MKKLAGTTWGAESSILTKVYTATVQPAMENASTTWGTAAKTNKSRLDRVQNMPLRVILGAMKTTPVHDTGKKTANVEPLARRRSLKVLIQGEKLRRLPSHSLHTKLAQPTKNRPKRQSEPTPVQRTVHETPRLCGCASRVADRSCLEA